MIDVCPEQSGFFVYIWQKSINMDSKQIRSFDNVNDCVKHFLKEGHGIKSIVMAFSKEHTIVIGKYSINIAPMKRMKKKERAEHLKSILPGIFQEKTWLERFEKEFSKWNAK